ncbi:TPA: DUF4059 family protein [Streptococcus suis]|uniref:DUF4059 family protein n=1 Tax=Streptococcus suis TaxID=1307 RepID=UPI0003FD8930|nr:DUF4059 family protein [Streptococcus suis]MBY5005870.1 DUF4059 family protein [Streptococcus suis]MBY5021880.1 DUF4059 family protein [Streptococcus suis]MCQ8266160.1 DUF4059 family protein [Streptococcus suis]HEL1584575.1 DUF4059 family protein [Streptococcus suis]HEL1640482.1 DUF4059 family protein [Streptococcus suis]
MLQIILGLYLQSLLISTGIVVFVSLCALFLRLVREIDKTRQERQEFLFDLLTIIVMTIPILSFGVVGILLMLRA